MEKPVHRGRHRIDVENEIIRKREKQYNYEQMWQGATRYFDHWQKNNTRFESWTSPRYYEDNNKLMKEIRSKRDKEELLIKRRERLARVLDEDKRSYEIELMVLKNKPGTEKGVQTKLDDIPTEVLKDINVELRLKEDERRRHEAELKLYHQWRRNNPIVRQFESKYRCRDIKLSWLDQQIEKRMQKEKEEEENRRILRECEEQEKKDKEKEEVFKRYVEEKRQQLKSNLDQQMAELRKRQEANEELKMGEYHEMKKRNLLAEIEETKALEEKRRANRECALFNVQHHKRKLTQRAQDIQENLEQEKMLVQKLQELNVEDILADEIKHKEIKDGLREFLNVVKQQQDLEKQRQKHLEFLFDSEAKSVYEKQSEIWKQEETARQTLIRDVIGTVKSQIEGNLERNQNRQREILEEREEMVRKIEEYNDELQRLAEEEQARKRETRAGIDRDVKAKNARKKLEENVKLKEINEELERIRKEEERLQQEIRKIQQRPARPRSSKIIF